MISSFLVFLAIFLFFESMDGSLYMKSISAFPSSSERATHRILSISKPVMQEKLIDLPLTQHFGDHDCWTKKFY